MMRESIQGNIKSKIEKCKPLANIIRTILRAVRARRSEKQSFELLHFNQFTLHFSLLALKDQRGIGRVSRELLSELEKISTKSKEIPSNPPEIYFYPTLHWCPRKLQSKSIALVYDVIPIIFKNIFKEQSREWESRYIKIAQQASRIVTISQTSAIDIAHYIKISDKKISVIGCGVKNIHPTTDQIDLPPEPYFVFVGATDKHKNIDIIFRSMILSGSEKFNFAIIGNSNRLHDKVDSMGLIKRVFFLGKLPDEMMGLVVSKAVAMVFPSWYEGFGMPPLEAALLGTPSICSRRPAMTELLHGAALFADPDEPSQWANAMHQMIEDKDLRCNLSKKASEIAREMTFEQMALKLLATCQNLARNAE